MSQCELIAKFLKDFGSITTFESYLNFGITRLPSRIHDLKNRGYEFKKEWVTKKTDMGKQ